MNKYIRKKCEACDYTFNKEENMRHMTIPSNWTLKMISVHVIKKLVLMLTLS